MTFGIEVDDGSSVLSELVSEETSKKVVLRDWQRRAIDYFFSHRCQAIFQVVTGAGKTFCAIEIIKEIYKKEDINILIVVPKNVILEQTWFKELYDNGISLTDVGTYYGFAKEYSKVTITNMQNLHKVSLDFFDMLILDECFSVDTKILVYENNKYKEKEIKDIVNNKECCNILSYNIKNNKLENKKITNWFKIKDKREVIDIEFEDQSILTVTPEQLIYNGKQYIKASELKEGNSILAIKNES